MKVMVSILDDHNRAIITLVDGKPMQRVVTSADQQMLQQQYQTVLDSVRSAHEMVPVFDPYAEYLRDPDAAGTS